MDNVIRAIYAIAVCALLLTAFCVTGQMDYADAVAQEKRACRMVAEGKWPAAQIEGYDCPERVAGASYEHN